LPPILRRQGETLLVAREERYTFIPLIHEVAAGRVHPESVLTPVSPDGDAAPFGTLRAEATGVDLENRVLHTSSVPVRYRYLILAPGSVAAPPPKSLSGYFQTFGSLEDALRLRSALDEAWRGAMRRKKRPGEVTVAVVGGGATGVELAAEIAALFKYLEKRAVRELAEEPRVVLFEATDRLMSWLDQYFHKVALEELLRLGVEVRLNTPVTAADEGGVVAKGGRLPAATRVWATGVRSNPLVRGLPGEHDDVGRVRVDGHLTLPDHPEVYVLGDNALYEDGRHGPLPATASVAVQHGSYAARDLSLRVREAPVERRRPFRFFNRGYAVSLGPEYGVADPLGVRIRGRAAQALYRSIFLYYMKSTRGRILTGADWAMERTLGRVGFASQAAERTGR
jgi:NADH dehydrogenase FAD-containing subunit